MDKTAEEKAILKKQENARRNRERRARDGDRINQEKRDKRASLKAIKTIKVEITTPILKKSKTLPPQSTIPKQDTTKYNYITFIKAYYKKHTGNDLLEDADIIKKINEHSYKALAISRQFKPILVANIKDIIKNPNQVKLIYTIFRGIRGFTDIEKQLDPYLAEYIRQYQQQRSQVIATDDDLNRIDFNNQEEYETNLSKLDNIADKVIYSFMLVIKGRVGDLRMTKITTNKNDIKNEEYNWVFENKLYINHTKNNKKLIIDLPDNLRFWNSIPSGYILGRLIPAPTYSQQIQRIFLNLYGKTYTASNLRHLYATFINNKGSSLEEREASAKQSGHSAMEQLSYVYKVKK